MDITVAELKARLDAGEQNFFLLDVREPHERDDFNIGGEHIPMGFVLAQLDELADHQQDEVIVYCRSGNRSGMVQGLLQQKGFTNVRNLLGGMLAWEAAYGR